jgi:hypothetical protein
MEFKFNIKRKITDMENPKNNSETNVMYFVEKNETFEDDGNDGHIFKLIDGVENKVKLSYDRNYLVKNEHKAYDYNTILELNQTKQITSMWGRAQITITITYLGVEKNNTDSSKDEDSKENSTIESLDSFKENEFSDK